MTNTLYDSLFAQHEGNEAPFLQLDDGRVVSYDAFHRRAAQIAHVLKKSGVSPGDRIVVQAPKLADTIALYAASVQAGAVYMPLNTAYTLAELDYFISDAQPALIVCDTKDKAELEQLAARCGANLLTLGGEDSSLSHAADEQPCVFETLDRGAEDLAALLYTSGTTGRSKGAMLSHRNLLSNAQTLVDLWGITNVDRLVHALPIFHTHGLFVAMNTSLLAGAKVRLMERFDVGVILDELPRSTLLMGVPTFYTRLLADEGFTNEVTGNMRLFISGSAPLLAETHVAFEARTGHRILERYGMTETNMNTSNPYSGERRAGTVGMALPGTEVIVTNPETGESLPQGEVGMIEVRGPNVFKGYWRMPEKTAEELRENEFFITGDLGRYSEEGYLSIVGRSKDLIITGGYNVYPKEIEDILNDFNGVLESAVFGVPDSDFGEAIIAVLVADPGAQLDMKKLAETVKDKLSRFKHPRSYEIVSGLPRNTMGKVQKNVLRDQYSQKELQVGVL
ncbi:MULTISPECIES: malonyl-CoA synthase [unclassified Ruegeria]|uniref:malonate--CoA ligase n=1 Tax=unclassified Ruegeria TaxID=2625375 RepID=UPI0014888E16|nr:AMP-binding protein [Ruegeria sp. HKCCD4332]NOD88804.1 AMP-binding protein [Ruegeria sp. HKCCD4318]NOE16199.1 AMP-binding protein [Ruegeria sp. HKCCD4318-2]NOG09869.1 malonyl-CoA synthase [Ruegeria sp. HKCCD4315]